ncbi:hypothetical protein [Kocuria sp.]|uniref:hypothetical protein n=1 Tax=Kocuria sp. TaxID=1871328 RepID=UPI0026DC4012|nr:hypothetical protein [Kocuria sp.]MDO4918147.1 hypothetical protein [Kocuria sp.]
MASPHTRFRMTREARESLGDTFRRFRVEGLAAEPVIFGAEGKPEAVILPYQACRALAPLLEDLTIAATVRTRVGKGGSAPLSETAHLLGLNPSEFR